MTDRSAHLRCLLVLAASGTLALGLGGCGDDDDSGPAAGGESADVDLTAYCDAEIAQDQVFQNLDSDAPGFEAALEEAQAVVDSVVAAAPEELAEPIEVRADGFAAARESGDSDQFFTDEVVAADDEVHAYDLGHCDWQRVDITATEYHYAGDFPNTAGPVSFEVTNAGEQPHLLLVAREKDDVDGDALDVFNALESEDDLPGSFDMVASVFVAPDEEGRGLVDLAPGHYVAFCPIPVGASLDNGGEADGPPHFTQGMVTAFDVAS